MSSSIARMNLFLHGIVDFEIERGNTLSEPRFLDHDRLQQFDVVLANPPYSIKQWDRQLWASDPYGRNRFGTPPQSRADFAFFQHILASMKTDTGRCAVLLPHGVLFRGEEREMRKRIVEADLIDCVLGLGAGLFYNSPMEACVLFCRTDKPAERKGKVLFVDAVNEVARERAQSFLREQDQHKILAAVAAFEDQPGFAAVATLEEIERNGHGLAIPLYVKPVASLVGERTDLDVSASVTAWRAAAARTGAAVGGAVDTLRGASSQ